MKEALVEVQWVEPGIALITIKREKALNALNKDVLDQLEQAIATVESEPQARVAIVQGQGERAFVAGADIAAIESLQGQDQALQFAGRGQAVFQRFSDSRIIFLAAINGYALGGGLELAMALDIRIACESARLGQPEINLGIIPGFGGTQRLARLIGPGRALLMIASGEPIKAAEAYAMGLVDVLVSADRLLEECVARARTLNQKPPLALAQAKRLIAGSRDWQLDQGLLEEREAFARLAVTEDGREGTRAFLQKRHPEFQGR